MAKNGVFWLKTKQNFIILLVFMKNANFFAENRQKSQKIVIITPTQDFAPIGSSFTSGSTFRIFMATFLQG
jgi:hypothetical protein